MVTFWTDDCRLGRGERERPGQRAWPSENEVYVDMSSNASDQAYPADLGCLIPRSGGPVLPASLENIDDSPGSGSKDPGVSKHQMSFIYPDRSIIYAAMPFSCKTLGGSENR